MNPAKVLILVGMVVPQALECVKLTQKAGPVHFMLGRQYCNNILLEKKKSSRLQGLKGPFEFQKAAAQRCPSAWQEVTACQVQPQRGPQACA